MTVGILLFLTFWCINIVTSWLMESIFNRYDYVNDNNNMMYIFIDIMDIQGNSTNEGDRM